MQRPYVGLFGSYHGDWRTRCKSRLEQKKIAWYDPNDPAWNEINHENGDQKQALIDELVEKQHQGINSAACVIYHLGGGIHHDDGSFQSLPAFAARCELGFLTGRGVATFAYIEPKVTGRNYLWAQMKPYPHMRRSLSLEQALEEAIQWIIENTSDNALIN